MVNSSHSSATDPWTRITKPGKSWIEGGVQGSNQMNGWSGPFLPYTSTTDVLTAATLIYAIGAGITAAAGTRLALQWILVKGFKLYSFQLPGQNDPALLFFVTTSPCRDWVICAPAAFLGCGRHFSGALSGIEPLFPVTRCSHGRPLSYQQSNDRAEIRLNRRPCGRSA